MAQLSDNETFDIAQNDFKSMDTEVLSAALRMGFSTTDALEAALVCGITDDAELLWNDIPKNKSKDKSAAVYFYVDRCQIVDAYVDQIIHNEMPSISQIISHCIPRDISSLFEYLARFLRTLSPKSKQIIWEHAVKIKTADGVCPQTKHKEQIIRLFCDCVIVYIKCVHRNIAPFRSRIWIAIQPQVVNVAVFIHNKHHSLHREKFENDPNYFAAMIADCEEQYIVYQIRTPVEQKQERLKYVGEILKYLTERNAAREKKRVSQQGFDEGETCATQTSEEEKRQYSQAFSPIDEEEPLEIWAPQTPPMSPFIERDLSCYHLAGLIRTIRPKLKKRIWDQMEEAVRIKTDDGRKTVYEQTKDKEQINKLLTSCVKCFVEFFNKELDRAKLPRLKLNVKQVRKHLNMEDVAVFILNKYHPLDRDKFVNDETYFADMLEEYEQTHIVYRNGTPAKQTKTQLLNSINRDI